jgi:cytochrome c2
VPRANALVAAPLSDWADRRYIAGRFTNTPENLIPWIMSPQEMEPGTAMPDVGVTEADARDMAAYLYTLQRDR